MTISEVTHKDAPRQQHWGRLTGPGPDIIIAGTLGALTFAVHSLHYVLSQPFWLDESWVAVSTKLPLRAAPHVTAVSPLGWTVLLRGVFFGGPQGLRLVPLAFSMLSVIVAYLIGRTLPWSSLRQSRITGALAALAVLLARSSLLRNDLKPYTADAFITLTLLLLLSRLESGWTRRRLFALTAVSIAGFMISTVGLFVAAAIFVTLVAAQLAHREFNRAREAAIAGAVCGAGQAAVFLVIYQPHVQGNVTYYWRRYYVPVSKGFSSSVTFLYSRAEAMATYLGMGPLLVAFLFVLAGAVTIFRSGRIVLACTAPVLLVEMIVLSASRKYPLFDQRTSYFFTAMLAVFAAIGVAGFAQWLSRRTIVGATTAVAVLAALFAVNVRHDIRSRSIPPEDARTATRYVYSHARPNDIILVSAYTSYAFAYYWPKGTPDWRPSTSSATGFQPYYPDQPKIIVATNRDGRSISSALDDALGQTASDKDARIWLIRIHVSPAEDRLWMHALQLRRLTGKQIVPCNLLLVTRQTISAGVSTPAACS